MAVAKPGRKETRSSGQRTAEQATPRRAAESESLASFLRRSLLAEAMAAGELDLERDRDEIRDLAL
jgi:hypothetical protein